MNSSKEHSQLFSSVFSHSIEERGYEDYVLKLSNGKCFFNRRYLVLRNGIIAYYRDKPADFFSASNLNSKPKGKVHILDCEIKKVDTNYAKKKGHPYMFQISFFLSGRKKKVFWMFSVDSLSVLEEWLEAFEKSRNPIMAIDEEKEEASESNEQDKEQELQERERILREENFKKTLELERQKQEKKKKEQEENHKREELEKEIKRKEEEKKRKIAEKAERKKKEKNKKILESFWDYRYQGLLDEFMNVYQDDDIIDIGIKVFKLIGIFREASIHAAKVVINDLQLPAERRKVKKIQDSMFIYQNLLLYLSCEQSNAVQSKYLGHEFRASDILQDAVFFLAKTADFPVRVPLSSIVDFKGFRAYVVAVIPLDTELTVIHGLKTQDYYQTENALYTHLNSLTELLNIKSAPFQWEGGIVPVGYLSVFTQFHESLGYSKIEDLENYTDSTSQIYITRVSEILPLDMDFSNPPLEFVNRLRPEFFSDYHIPLTSNACINFTQEGIEEDDYEICEASLKVRTEKISEIIELLDSLTIMPIDSRSLTQALHANGINCRYLGLIVNRTALPHIKDLCLVEIVGRTCKRLLFQQLADLMLENTESEENPLENTRKTNEDYASIKVIEGNYYIESEHEPPLVINSDLNLQSEDYRINSFLTRFKKQLRWPTYKELKEKIKTIQSPRQNLNMEGSLKECIVDYLNLVFGIGEESDIFWQEILIPKAAANFSINPDHIDKSHINLHALLHSVCFHCSLQLGFSKDTMLGKIENPFSLQSLERIKEKTKVVAMKSIESKIIMAKVQGLEGREAGYESSMMSLEINKALNPDPEFLGDTLILADIGEMLVELKDFDAAIKYAKDALLQIHPLHAEGVKSWCILIRALMSNNMQDEALQCFDHALTALEYHWGPYHPLHCTLYSILAYLYMEKHNYEEALILYKNSLMCSLRVLGPNHPHTAEVYVELGNLYIENKAYSEAASAIEKGLSVYEASLGETAAVTITARRKLEQLYEELGREDKSPFSSKGKS
ncbi:hypothetical protein SteCoe_27794 [Stentor coeruleus]|uniref:PH domain-containing protein n=1 Tax=Stentor coeruleus TaxID=5963 RepID=A0A1R2B9Q1_9CILI|nr:hypothetical protein SteCoe_27794 [Stentor coeruleus]